MFANCRIFFAGQLAALIFFKGFGAFMLLQLSCHLSSAIVAPTKNRLQPISGS